MNEQLLSPHPIAHRLAIIAPRLVYLFLAAGVLFLAAWLTPDVRLRVLTGGIGASIIVSAVAAWLVHRYYRRRYDRRLAQISKFVQHDATASFIADEDGTVRYCNHVAYRLYPLDIGHPLAAAFKEVFADPSDIMHRLQLQAVKKGTAREDVVTRTGHMRLMVHVIEGGGFLWRFEDMWESQGASKGADGLSLPMLVANAKGDVLFMNEALRRLLGRRIKLISEIFPKPDWKGQRSAILLTRTGRVSCDLVILSGAGSRQEVYFLPPREVQSGPSDMAQLKDLPVAVLGLRLDGRISFANTRARQQFQMLKNGKDVLFSDVFTGVARPIEEWLANQTVAHGPELLRTNQNGKEHFVQASLMKQGQVRILVLQDATELKTLEAQFVQSQKMQAIGQLAGGVAHDFNNLLTAISGHCDLLLLRHEKSDPDYADLEQIGQNANRAASLVGQLLAFSRKQTLRMEVVDLKEVFSDLTHLLNRLVGEKVQLKFSYDPEVKPVFSDKRQLEQVMMNLVVNAKDAMPDGGLVEIETSGKTLRDSLNRSGVAVPAGDYSVIKVTDTGSGIPSTHIDKVFDPFFTSKPTGQGTGLGLATVYGIVKQTGGYIFVDSVPHQGACFTIYLPALKKGDVQLATQRPTDIAKPSPADEGVVLLVEDEESVRAFASRALRLRGYTVLEAEDAEHAKKILSDAALKVDVFVSDVVMPGENGPAWVREALKQRPDVKVIFVSGYAEADFMESDASIPEAVFLPKPFSLNDLTATVHRQLH